MDPERPARQRRFQATVDSVAAARTFVADSLRAGGAGTDLVSDFELVASELATNAINHGDGGFVIDVDHDDPGWWQVTVTGGRSSDLPAHLLQPDQWTVGTREQISGRGLGIVRFLMDDIVVTIHDANVKICCRKRR